MRRPALCVVAALAAGGACTGGSSDPDRPEGDWRPLFEIAADRNAGTTSAELVNYNLRVEFRRRRGRATTSASKSGIVYHLAAAEADAEGGAQGLELRVDQSGCGDFLGGTNVLADVEGVRQEPGARRGPVVYRRGEGRFTLGLGTPLGNRAVRAEEAERPVGEWNVLELIAVGRTSVHVVNGRPVMMLDNLRRRVAGKEVPLGRGRIRLASPDAGILFRHPQIRPVDEIPARYLPQAPSLTAPAGS
jgi:hypothetical protein